MTGLSLPFEIRAKGQRTTITDQLISNGNQVLGVRSTAGYFDAPLGRLMLFRGGDTFRMFLKGRVEQRATVANTPNDEDMIFDLAADGHMLIRSQRTSGDFVPGTSHPDVVAYHRIDQPDSEWQPAEISEVDWDAGTVTVKRPGGSRNVVLYFLTGDGEIELRIRRPLGSDNASAKIFNSALRSVHEVNQSNVRSALVFGVHGREYPLPSQFRLELAVRSQTPIVFDEFAQHELSIPVVDTPIKILNVAQMNAQTELKLRGGTL